MTQRVTRRVDLSINVLWTRLISLTCTYRARPVRRVESALRRDRDIAAGCGVPLILMLVVFGWPTDSTFAQGNVEGYVYEADTRDPLPGANVVIEGTNFGTSTDRNGYYRINGIPVGTPTLAFSSLGYTRQEVVVTITSGGTTRQDVNLRATALELGDVVITGLRRGQMRAINEKRQALSVMDVVSADEMGKLPDLNVAESAQRIPGITIRTDRGEGRFVSIRGTSPSRNNVSFNGQVMASAAGTRATALDLVPSEMVSTIEVTKAVTPDMDANALGGSVNISTLTAFDREARFLSLSVNGMQHQQMTDFGDSRFPFRSSLTAGTRFGANEAWGIVISGTASRRDFSSAVVSPGDWVEVDGVIAPEEYELEVEDNDRMRYSGNLNLDYRPTPRTSAFVRLHHSRREESFTNTEVIFAGGDVLPQSATSGALDDFEVQLDIPLTDINEQLYAITLGGEQRLGNSVIWDLQGTYTRGVRDVLTYQPEWGFDQGFSGSYDLSGDKPRFTLANPDEVSNPDQYVFDEMDIEMEDLVENTWQVGTDLQWNLRFGRTSGFLKTGAQFRMRDKDIDRNEDPWAAGDEQLTVGQFFLETPEALRGAYTGATRLPITGNVRAFLDFWEQNRDSAVDYFALDPVESAEEEVEADAEVTEDVYAGYLMGSFQFGALTATGGLRLEATETTSNRYRFIIDSDADEAIISQQSESNSYVDFLPSLHLVYRVTNALQFRAAWSNTIGRPDYEELAAFQDYEFDEVEEGVWEAAIEEGNPDLKPYRAMNFDLTAEYYWGPGGLLSLGAFYKRIADPIYGFEFTERDVFGRDFAEDIDIPGFGDRLFREVDYEQLRNADSGVIRGIEASFMQILSFLPGPLRGLGIASNIAIMDSDVTVPGRDDEDLPFFDQSGLVYNIAPYYQAGDLELRVAINYQSDYLSGVSSDAFEDSYGDERFTIDLSGRYEFMDGRLQLNAYVRNLTNEAERDFQGRRNRISYHELTGRTFELGVGVRL